MSETITSSNVSLVHLQESGIAKQSEEWENQSEASLAAMREEAEILQSTLREITNAVRQDADSTSKLLGSPSGEIEVVDAGLLEGAEDDFFSKRPISPSRAARLRSSSPTRARSPAVSDNAIATVHSAIQKKNIQVMVCVEQLFLFQLLFKPVNLFFSNFFLALVTFPLDSK